MTGNKMRPSPLSDQIFAMQVKATIRVCYVQGNRLSVKKEQNRVCQSTFLSLACDTKDILPGRTRTFVNDGRKKIRRFGKVIFDTSFTEINAHCLRSYYTVCDRIRLS
jgi:hypothetical protein